MFAAYIAPAAFASILDVFALFSMGILSMGIGCLVCNFFNGFKPKTQLAIYRSSNFHAGILPSKYLVLGMYASIFIAMVFSSYYFYKVGISLFSDDVGYERLVARHNVSGSYIYQRFFRVFLPILCMIYFLLGRCDETKRFYNPIIFILVLIITTSFLMFTGMRGNILIFIFFPFMALIGLYSNQVNFFRILILLFFTIFGGMFVTTLMYPDLDIFALVNLIFVRLTTGASDGISYMVGSDLPSNGFYYGKTYFNDFMSLFYKLGLTNYEFQNYGSYLAQSMLGERYNGEQASIFVMGELYANFGYLGLIIGSFVLGIILQKSYISILYRKKTVLFLPIFIYFLSLFIAILGGPTLSMLIDYTGTVFIFFILLIFSISFFAFFKGRFIFLNKKIILR